RVKRTSVQVTSMSVPDPKRTWGSRLTAGRFQTCIPLRPRLARPCRRGRAALRRAQLDEFRQARLPMHCRWKRRRVQTGRNTRQMTAAQSVLIENLHGTSAKPSSGSASIPHYTLRGHNPDRAHLLLVASRVEYESGFYGFFLLLPGIFLASVIFDRGSGFYATVLSTLLSMVDLNPTGGLSVQPMSKRRYPPRLGRQLRATT